MAEWEEEDTYSHELDETMDEYEKDSDDSELEDLVDSLTDGDRVEKKSQYGPGKHPNSHKKGTGSPGEKPVPNYGKNKGVGPGSPMSREWYENQLKDQMGKAREAAAAGHKGKAAYHADNARTYSRTLRAGSAVARGNGTSTQEQRVKQYRSSDRANRYSGKVSMKALLGTLGKSFVKEADTILKGYAPGKHPNSHKGKMGGASFDRAKATFARDRAKSDARVDRNKKLIGESKNPDKAKSRLMVARDAMQRARALKARGDKHSASAEVALARKAVRGARKVKPKYDEGAERAWVMRQARFGKSESFDDIQKARKKSQYAIGKNPNSHKSKAKSGADSAGSKAFASGVARGERARARLGHGLASPTKKDNARVAEKRKAFKHGPLNSGRLDKRDDTEMYVPIVKTDKKEQIVYGWASPVRELGEDITDKQGDVIDMAEVRAAAHEFMTNKRVGGSMHKTFDAGNVVESVCFDRDLQDALGINLPYEGWFIGVKVTNADDWARVESGEFTGFSIGGSGVREAMAKGYAPGKNPNSHKRSALGNRGARKPAKPLTDAAKAKWGGTAARQAGDFHKETQLHLKAARKAMNDGNKSKAAFHASRARDSHTAGRKTVSHGVDSFMNSYVNPRASDKHRNNKSKQNRRARRYDQKNDTSRDWILNKSDPGPSGVHVSGPAKSHKKTCKCADCAKRTMKSFDEVQKGYAPGKNPNSHKKLSNRTGSKDITERDKKASSRHGVLEQSKQQLRLARKAKSAGNSDKASRHAGNARFYLRVARKGEKGADDKDIKGYNSGRQTHKEMRDAIVAKYPGTKGDMFARAAAKMKQKFRLGVGKQFEAEASAILDRSL